MIKHQRKMSWFLLLAVGLLCTGQLYVSATELESEDIVTTNMEMESEATTEVATESIMEEEKADLSTKEQGVSDSTQTQEASTASATSEEVTSEETTESEVVKSEDTEVPVIDRGGDKSVVVIPGIDELEQQMKAKENGLYYYLNKYQYDCRATYMETYIAYMELEVAIYQEMYNLGEVTETLVNSCKAQKFMAEAELQMARNESAYYALYLTENKLDYSDFNIRERKEIRELEYYKENYPDTDCMVFARYITDYDNAILGIESKAVEVEALKEEVSMSELLVREGELSKRELEEKKVSLAQVEYELEQYYVQMNIAYLNLKPYHE